MLHDNPEVRGYIDLFSVPLGDVSPHADTESSIESPDRCDLVN